jgi:hypothetical protein
MPDIRSFFGPKGGGPPPKPLPKKVDEPAKGGTRTSQLCNEVDLQFDSDADVSQDIAMLSKTVMMRKHHRNKIFT